MQRHYLLYFAWMISILATVGSLFFSEVLHFPPCVLCWYQRVFMYPLPFLLTVGILMKDRFLPTYVLSIAPIGWLISVYHVLLYYKIIPDQLAPCTLGVSCTTKYVEYFGFITIPFLSFLSFSCIIVAMIVYKRGETR